MATRSTLLIVALSSSVSSFVPQFETKGFPYRLNSALEAKGKWEINPNLEPSLWVKPQEKAKPTEAKKRTGLELFLKAGPDGSSVGDCPFAQFVQIVLAVKGIEHKLSPHSKDTKPRWLVDGYDGKMPCLLHSGEAYTESDNIVDYIQFFFPEPRVPRGSSEASSAVEGFFPTLAAFLKNTDETEDESLEALLVDSLGRIDAHLSSKSTTTCDSRFMDGPAVSLVDCSLAPKLHHMAIAADHFKGFQVPEKFVALRAYMEAVSELDAVASTCPPRDTVVWGWETARSG
eukprot:CAMPEP_0185770050 /NCGR_PEP_ID=MMETSP1174-20130828/57274_1 /TAXON_ID=35687 /ORGANISM="Dictyocha speculum, Strain CCMP1381" /LENGTH=287 /DNA_ID=CAMNT_0028455345 /DNA_START=23 /DNA_END=886 /DNA_ORIENTATION=+